MASSKHKAWKTTRFIVAGGQVLVSISLAWLCVSLGTGLTNPYCWSSSFQGLCFVLSCLFTAVLWGNDLQEEKTDD